MNWYLDWRLQQILKPESIRSDLEVAPLSVLTISDLEYLEPFLTDTPFHKHLDYWNELFEDNMKVIAFRSYVYTLRKRDLRNNEFIEQRYDQIRSEMLGFFEQLGLHQEPN